MSYYPPDYEPEEPAEVDCPDCHGGGFVEEGPCRNCNGTGLVPNPQLSDWMQDQIRFKRNQY